MSLSIGVDVVDVDRLRRTIDLQPGIEHDLFTDSELAVSRSVRHACAFLAACLAAKEAFLKATGVGLRDGLVFRDIEIITDAAGISGIRLQGILRARSGDIAASEQRVSAAFTQHVACAVVVLSQEGRRTDEPFRVV
jgi:holo-[acyl-carrier protein] synthase